MISSANRDARTLDRIGYSDSPIHNLDPRAKVVATLVFVASVASCGKYELSGLAPFALFPVAMAILGFVPLGVVARRVLFALPFIFFIGAFNPYLDRAPMLEIGGVSISGGWVSFASIFLRGVLCVSAGVMLVATTSMTRIAEALSALKTPDALVTQLMLLYRYLFLLQDEASRMNRARALRAGTSAVTIGTAGAMLSSLLIRAVDRSESLWRAMRIRGFDGKIKTSRPMAWRSVDTAFAVGVISTSLLFRLVHIPRLIERIGFN